MARKIAGLATLLLITAACGQKPGVAEQPLPPQPVLLALPAGATVDPETGQVIDAQGNVIGDADDFGDLAVGSDGGAVTTDTEGSQAGSKPGGSAPTTVSGPPAGGDSTGVDDDVIRIGAHAPLTGAAPVPSDSAQKGVQLYWRWLQEMGGEINGRRVETILRNDQYNPSTAVSVCKEMVEKDKVFMLYGFAGTDQIQACARYAASVGVPYVSVGVTEVGLTTYTDYFAISLSYVEQAPLLADLLTSSLGAGDEKNGMLRFDTPMFQDAHDAFVDAMKDRGTPLAYDRGVSKGAGASEARTVVQEMKNAGIENVYVLTSPVWFLQVLQEARTQQFTPQWVGVGLTKALDTVSAVGCRNGTLSRAKFFSPFPAWADINRFDPDFKKAVRRIYPEKGEGDDIMLIPWGMSKILGGMLEAPGRNLTRERFVYFAQQLRNLKTGV
ncbi:MAG TPA: ABC transporter substrate-binding protein, partial [Actinomycetota bacterium]|nr:ABC transporter substrate-binding protein [Actinomycetota bacterium]